MAPELRQTARVTRSRQRPLALRDGRAMDYTRAAAEKSPPPPRLTPPAGLAADSMASNATHQTEKRQMERPDFRMERRLQKRGVWPVAGVDEAGRGPLAGPVAAAAVILDPQSLPRGLDRFEAA